MSLEEDHEKIFALLAEITERARVEGGLQRKDRTDFARNVIEYCTSHFHEEQQEMKKCGYPHYLRHREEHERFTKLMIDESMRRCLTDKPEELVAFIREHFITHIMTWDDAYTLWRKQELKL